MSMFSLKIKFWCGLSNAAIFVVKSASSFSRYCLRKGLDAFKTKPDAAAELCKELEPWLERCHDEQS